MGLPLRDHEFHTYGDYASWTDEMRCELIQGIAYAMGPASARRHQEVAGEMFRQIADVLDGSPCRPYIAPFDVRLPRANEADEDIDTVVQPDISVICDKSKLDERGCRGAPDWIVEVLSSGTASHDQIVKRALYERVGVREYWLIDPIYETIHFFSQAEGELLPIPAEQGVYHSRLLKGFYLRPEWLFPGDDSARPSVLAVARELGILG